MQLLKDMLGGFSGDGGAAADDSVKAELDLIKAKADLQCQIFTKQITSAANAGDVTVATITTQPCQIESVVVRSNGATTADLTSIAISGGAGKVVVFLSAVEGIRANIAAADQQIFWEGAVTLAATKTIVITLAGTGATAVDLQVDTKYRPVVAGGTLA
jgi:hypothetical protein